MDNNFYRQTVQIISFSPTYNLIQAIFIEFSYHELCYIPQVEWVVQFLLLNTGASYCGFYFNLLYQVYITA